MAVKQGDCITLTANLLVALTHKRRNLSFLPACCAPSMVAIQAWVPSTRPAREQGVRAAHFTDSETALTFSICGAGGRTGVSCMLDKCSTAELLLQTSPIFKGSPLSRDSKTDDSEIDNLVTPQPCLSCRAFVAMLV